MDFSSLKDEQIPELVRLLVQESLKRGLHVSDVVRAVMMDANQKATLERQETQRNLQHLRFEQEMDIKRKAVENAALQFKENRLKKARDIFRLLKHLSNFTVSHGNGFIELTDTITTFKYYTTDIGRFSAGTMSAKNEEDIDPSDFPHIKEALKAYNSGEFKDLIYIINS
jgi:hypothetical protein